jgi:hypothetical protein
MILAPLASKPTTTAPINALLSGTPVDLPAVGDTWTYNATLGPSSYSNFTTTVTGIPNILDWNGSSVPCYNFTDIIPNPTAHGLNASWNTNLYRTSDGAEIAGETYSLANTTGSYTETYSFSYTNEPIINIAFPYNVPWSVGEIWNQTITTNTTGYQSVSNPFPPPTWLNTTWVRANATQSTAWFAVDVLNITTVTVPAGTFETWCANETSNALPPVLIYYSPSVKFYVLVTNATDGSPQLELLSYSVSYPTLATIQNMMTLFLLSLQYQTGTTMTYLIIGGVAGTIIVVAATGIIMSRHR